MFKFFRRFGGDVSFEQRLVDAGRKMPGWLQPVWQVVALWIIEWLRELKVAAEMTSVDQQAAEISEGWTQAEDAERTAEAERMAARLQVEFPDAKVSVVPVANGEGSDVAIFVKHPPDGSAAQELLGGAVEIRSPWVER